MFTCIVHCSIVMNRVNLFVIHIQTYLFGFAAGQFSFYALLLVKFNKILVTLYERNI